MPVKVVVALLMFGFAFLEIVPTFQQLECREQWLPLGGLLSGFFGGLSGHQGALRSALLVKAGLSKEQFLGTGIVIAILVDVSRLSIYSKHLSTTGLRENSTVLAGATLSAFAGAWIGSRLIKKVTMCGVQRLVACFLLLIAVGLFSGLI